LCRTSLTIHDGLKKRNTVIEGLFGRSERAFQTGHEQSTGGGMGWNKGVKLDPSDGIKRREPEE
jgi:hypothetical protein